LNKYKINLRFITQEKYETHGNSVVPGYATVAPAILWLGHPKKKKSTYPTRHRMLVITTNLAAPEGLSCKRFIRYPPAKIPKQAPVDTNSIDIKWWDFKDRNH